MQIKGWRLSAASPFVNAAAGIALFFAATACSRQEAASPDTPGPVAVTAESELPAVWATRPLPGAVSDVALSSGSKGVLAVAYARGGLDFFDFDGERIGEPTRFRLKDLADGRAMTVGDLDVTVFPAVTVEGTLKAYVFSPGLMAPAQVDLPIVEARSVAGLCSGDAFGAGLMRIAYWTTADASVLKTGVLKETGGEFGWTEEAPTQAGFPVTACVFSGDTLVASPSSESAASLSRGTYSALLSLDGGGPLKVSTDYGLTSTEIRVRDGITIIAPKAPSALTALGTMQAGGYPGGIVVLAGETSDEVHQVVFVDPSALTSPAE